MADGNKDIKSTIKDLIFFKEPQKKKPFVLVEGKNEGKEENELSPNNPQKQAEDQTVMISSSALVNLNYIKRKFNVPKNSDVIIREFQVIINSDSFSAFIVFFDGMVERKVINDNILKPLMMPLNIDIDLNREGTLKFIKNHILTYQDLRIVKEQHDVIKSISAGECAIYIDGVAAAIIADVKGFEHRNVGKTAIEPVIRGSQEGFNEVIRVNTALIRKRLGDSQLIVEDIYLGKRSKTLCSILYIEDIANKSLVNEVRRRMQNIEVDYIFDTGELEQFLEEDSFCLVPQILSTERPDRTASLIADGRVAMLMNGSPIALIAPTTNSQFIQSYEDTNLRLPYANLLRFVRIFAVLLSLLLPATYVAIINFHQDLIPTSLLFAIAASREKVPFPAVLEIIIMEISFELIREAGIRVPGAMGQTLGVVAALILGQASVAANIVSPILIVIVAVTGIGSYSIPNYSYGFSFRMMRFVYIIFGAVAGLFGISLLLFLNVLFLLDAKSFGVPFWAPIAPKTFGVLNNEFFRNALWKQEKRPDYLNPQKVYKQSKDSMAWKKQNNNEENTNGE